MLTHLAMLRLLIFLNLIRRADLSEIFATGDASVSYGQDATLSCNIPHAQGVRQVTWERRSARESVETLATFSEQHQNHVTDKFVGRVTFSAVSMNTTSIVIKNATFEDEACYICSFKSYPQGAKRETLRLTVIGISYIKASLDSGLSSDPDVTISCSATGKPSPTLQWTSPETDLRIFSSTNYTTHNSDGSTTITSNITFPRTQFQGNHVECLAQSGGTEKRYHLYIDHPGKDGQENLKFRYHIIPLIILFVVFIAISAFYLTSLKDKKVEQSDCKV